MLVADGGGIEPPRPLRVGLGVQAQRIAALPAILVNSGGRRGIRTLEGLFEPPTGLANRRHRPLGHPSFVLISPAGGSAEGARFELADDAHHAIARFRNGCLRPLGHPSAEPPANLNSSLNSFAQAPWPKQKTRRERTRRGLFLGKCAVCLHQRTTVPHSQAGRVAALRRLRLTGL